MVNDFLSFKQNEIVTEEIFNQMKLLLQRLWEENKNCTEDDRYSVSPLLRREFVAFMINNNLLQHMSFSMSRNQATYEEIELTQDQANALATLPKNDDGDLKSIPLGSSDDVK